ncbi:quinone oxidoreductase [Streptomyces olivaceiscleroticus]|uniref:Quinone oxidoreductase n=2 Tax=Streptomyces olivaceiscleroticus TaxID=68245 RepID=A0ABN1B6G8_9ACTN
MQAVVVERFGGPEVLTVQDLPAPTPGPGEIVVRTSAIGVNFKDIYEREGRAAKPTPFIPGSEAAGRVLSVGPDTSDFAPGDRVAFWSAPGSYAEQVRLPARAAVPVPDDVSDEEAAALLLQGLTAHYLITSTYSAAEGETALVHAAAGGLGQLLTRLLSRRGVRVFGTVSTQEKAVAAKAAGVHDVVVVNDDTNVGSSLQDLVRGRGVDVVYDGVGRTTFEASLKVLRPRGTYVLVGAASGPVDPISPQDLAAHGSLFLTRPTLVDHATERSELLDRAHELFTWLRRGDVEPSIGGRYRLADAATAHTALQLRRSTGKLLLFPERSESRPEPAPSAAPTSRR